MRQELSYAEDALAPSTLADWVRALNRLVTNLLLLVDASTTTLADNVHKVAVVKLVCA